MIKQNQNTFWPVIVTIAESSNWDGEGLPHRVQRILDHLCLMADGKPGNKQQTESCLKVLHVCTPTIVGEEEIAPPLFRFLLQC